MRAGMPKLIPSLRLMRRTLECEIAYTLSRMAVLERIPGNPVGIACRHIDGGAVALMARYLPALGRELARLGYYQSGFHTSLICEPDLALPTAGGDGIVERVESAAALEAF